MRKSGIVLSLRGQVILQWLVLVHLDKIIPAVEVLFKVGGLEVGSTRHITPITGRRPIVHRQNSYLLTLDLIINKPPGQEWSAVSCPLCSKRYLTPFLIAVTKNIK